MNAITETKSGAAQQASLHPLSLLVTVRLGVALAWKRAREVGAHLTVLWEGRKDWIVAGDAAMIEEIFVRLLLAPIDHTPANGHVRLSLKRRGDVVICQVTAAAETFLYSRLALGEAIAKIRPLVELQRGAIWVEKHSLAEGRICFTLPLWASPRPAPPRAAGPVDCL